MSFAYTLDAFAFTGLLFGTLTFTRRHLFSEGPTRPTNPGVRAPLQDRLAWVVLCTVLWPVLVFTGAMSWWLRRGA